MDTIINYLINYNGENSILLQLLTILFLLYIFVRFLAISLPKVYQGVEKYRKKRNELSHRNKLIRHFPNEISELNSKLDKLSASVENFIQFSNRRDDELSSKIDILFRKQEEIQHQQNEDKADSIRESILNFAERLRNNPDGDYSIEKFNQIFALGSKYKKIIEENEITNDVFVHDYEYIETQYNKRFNKDKE